MSGETEQQVSGWTTDTLKILHDQRFAALDQLAEIRNEHARQLREADQMALRLALDNTADHFERLNENAARTIEERAHFVANEVFAPFRDQVNEALAVARGRQSGVGLSASAIVAGAVALAAIISVVVVLVNAWGNNDPAVRVVTVPTMPSAPG